MGAKNPLPKRDAGKKLNKINKFNIDAFEHPEKYDGHDDVTPLSSSLMSPDTRKHNSSTLTGQENPSLTREDALKAASVLSAFDPKQKIPTFGIYSRLDKALIKLALMKTTEIPEEELEAISLKYFGRIKV